MEIYTIPSTTDVSVFNIEQHIVHTTRQTIVENETPEHLKETRIDIFASKKLRTLDLYRTRLIDILVNFRLVTEIKLNLLKESLWVQSIYGPAILIAAVAASFVFTLWPQHNIILQPECWYEPMGPILTSYCMLSAANCIYGSYLLTKIDELLSWKNYFKLLAARTGGFMVPYVSLYVIWVHFLWHRHPLPFIGQMCGLTSQLGTIVVHWYLFPYNLRKNNGQFRNRIVYYILLYPLLIVISVVYSNISSLFFSMPISVQWVLGCFLPIVKLFNIWITKKVGFKVAGGKTLDANIQVLCIVGTLHSFFYFLFLDPRSNLWQLT